MGNIDLYKELLILLPVFWTALWPYPLPGTPLRSESLRRCWRCARNFRKSQMHSFITRKSKQDRRDSRARAFCRSSFCSQNTCHCTILESTGLNHFMWLLDTPDLEKLFSVAVASTMEVHYGSLGPRALAASWCLQCQAPLGDLFILCGCATVSGFCFPPGKSIVFVSFSIWSCLPLTVAH